MKHSQTRRDLSSSRTESRATPLESMLRLENVDGEVSLYGRTGFHAEWISKSMEDEESAQRQSLAATRALKYLFRWSNLPEKSPPARSRTHQLGYLRKSRLMTSMNMNGFKRRVDRYFALRETSRHRKHTPFSFSFTGFPGTQSTRIKYWELRSRDSVYVI